MDCGRPEHPDQLRVVGELLRQARAQRQPILALRIVPKGVVVNGAEALFGSSSAVQCLAEGDDPTARAFFTL